MDLTSGTLTPVEEQRQPESSECGRAVPATHNARYRRLGLIAEVADAGGLTRWDPGEVRPVDAERQVLAWLKSTRSAGLDGPTLYLGYVVQLDGFSWSYIASYAQSSNPQQVGRLCMRVLDKTKKVLDLIYQPN